VTLGMSFIISDACLVLWGGDSIPVPTPQNLQAPTRLFGFVFPTYRLVLVGCAVTTAVILYLMLERTRLGAMIRAGVDDRQMARAVGIPVSNLFTIVFCLGAGIAGAGGVLGGPILSAYPGLDADMLPLALIVVILGGIGSLIGAFVLWVVSLPPLPLAQASQVSTTIVDRNGKLLRAYAMADGRWRLQVDARKDVDPTYLKLLLAYEDQRFRAHHGVDPLALGRAALQLISRGHIVSGGSTITMQLARLMEPRRERSLYAKLHQIVRAFEIERALNKDQILNLYLALAPYGGNLEGIRAASIAYFGKEPKRLSLAEAALLVALPQSPETRRLDRHPDAAREGRDRVLDRMVEEHRISADEAAQAKAAAVPRMRKAMPILAPHSSDQAMEVMRDTPVIRLTLDASLQKVLEPLARDRATALGPNISVGIIVVDNDTGDVLAHVGSADYFDETRAGQVDMTRAVRSPGSTLKPFIYGLAFEDGFVHPESLIDDRPIRFDDFQDADPLVVVAENL